MRVRPLPSLACIGTLAGLVISSCGSGQDAAPTASPPTRSAASGTVAVPAELLGTYERTVTRADITRTTEFRHEGSGQEAPSPGPARLVITRSSITFVVPTPLPPLWIGEDYTATANGHLIINGYTHPDVGSFCGPEIPQNASYTWARKGGAIELRSVRDRCADRDSSLTGTWRRTE